MSESGGRYYLWMDMTWEGEPCEWGDDAYITDLIWLADRVAVSENTIALMWSDPTADLADHSALEWGCVQTHRVAISALLNEHTLTPAVCERILRKCGYQEMTEGQIDAFHASFPDDGEDDSTSAPVTELAAFRARKAVRRD